jgi:hypothetical protein
VRACGWINLKSSVKLTRCKIDRGGVVRPPLRARGAKLNSNLSAYLQRYDVNEYEK